MESALPDRAGTCATHTAFLRYRSRQQFQSVSCHDSSTGYVLEKQRCGGNLGSAPTLAYPHPATIRPTFNTTPQTGSLYLQIGNRIFKSTNNADSWSVQSTLPGTNSAFDVCGSSPARMYDGQYEALYRSDNEGQSWNAIANVIPPPSPVPAVRTGIGVVAVDFNNCALVFASIGGPDSSRISLYRNANAGAGPFAEVAGYITQWYNSPPGAYYARAGAGWGTLRSTNLGLTWTSFPPGTTLSAVDPKFSNILYGLANSAALVRSTDSGNTWSPIPATATPTLSKTAAPLTVTAELAAKRPSRCGWRRWKYRLGASPSRPPPQANPGLVSIKLRGRLLGTLTVNLNPCRPYTRNLLRDDHAVGACDGKQVS